MDALINFQDLSTEKVEEFEEIIDQYIHACHLINLFINNNNLEDEEVWEKAKEAYEEDLTYAPELY